MLLSCRLAYREVAHVLYAENTLHVSTGALLLFTERLLPRERTAAVTSLIYHAKMETLGEYAAEHLGLEQRGWPVYEVLLRRIPLAFPSLRRLTVIFPCRDGRGLLKVVEGEGEYGFVGGDDESSNDHAMRNRITAPMDAIVAAFGSSLQECVLLVDETAFDAHFSRTNQDDTLDQEQGQGQTDYLRGWWGVSTGVATTRCIWRRLGAVDEEDDSGFSNAGGVDEQGTPGTGYWIRDVSQAENYMPEGVAMPYWSPTVGVLT